MHALILGWTVSFKLLGKAKILPVPPCNPRANPHGCDRWKLAVEPFCFTSHQVSSDWLFSSFELINQLHVKK